MRSDIQLDLETVFDLLDCYVRLEDIDRQFKKVTAKCDTLLSIIEES